MVQDEQDGARRLPGGGPVVAAVDIGSNSIKMTVGRPDGAGGIEELAVASETVRLGAGIERTGRLAEDRIEAALGTLRRFADQARALGAARLVGVATEATRVAANGPEFLARVGRETGFEVRPITGDEEADLTFRGLAATGDVRGDVVVADIGGGSTELIVARDGAVRGARSLPIGSGRLTDRLVETDPPTAAELDACRRVVAGTLAELADKGLALPRGGGTRLLVVGGTGEYLGRLVGDGPLDAAAIDRTLERLEATPAAALAAELGIAEARARVLPAGVAAVRALADRIGPARIEVARSGIRAGLLLAAFDEAAQPRMNEGGDTIRANRTRSPATRADIAR